ncbi:glycosyltransferase family 2 protein [Acetobacter senegalensis]|uniref:glycosyltransferase family 2 protein n=1 Tax=Acetobacter senegalensis TaxID=446692 RepID=UPI00265610CD|nr:glycosyltransferase family 2 protein [Acetobacter senegalensis]MDN7354667.1 glycosyltransferase family 2 protein [Acetobacter senegalensis]
MSGVMAITMAGMGSRFKKAGYHQPKYEIEVLGHPLFDWSMLSLTAFRDAGWRFCFATSKDMQAKSYIAARCKALGIIIDDVIELDHVTDGQATTALLLAQKAPSDAPFAVYNIDTFVRPGLMAPPNPALCDGWIPCFRAPGDGWSFVRLDDDQKVVEVREKVRISDFATLGLYWFRNAQMYCDLYHQHFARPDGMEKGERYIAPMYNRLIEARQRVTISDIPVRDVGMLGTPDQVKAFREAPTEAVNETLKLMP